MPAWKATDPRWKLVAEGRWPPGNPRTPKTEPAPGTFRSRAGHLRDRRRSRHYAEHGLTTLQKAVKTLGARAIDPESPVGQALTAWRSDLITDLGGAELVSTQQRAVIDVAVRTKLLLDSIDAWLLRQPALVNRRRKAVLPAVVQRQRLADSLAHYMNLLGLERRRPKPVSLNEYLQTPRESPPATEEDTAG